MKQLLEQYADLLRTGPHGLMSAGERRRIAGHIEDALAGLPTLLELDVRSFADIGSGGGLPGIPLALALPLATVHLIESQAWKARFLEETVATLGLNSRVRVWPERIETAVALIGRETLDCAICRALAPPAVSAEYLAPLVRPGGALVLWTTRRAIESSPGLDEVAEQLGLAAPSLVPAPSSLRADAALLVWPKAAPTPERFPRRLGVAAKRPLA